LLYEKTGNALKLIKEIELKPTEPPQPITPTPPSQGIPKPPPPPKDTDRSHIEKD
jgi:hypothetical protein